MRILYIVNAIDNENNPSVQPFVRAQINSIREQGHEVSILNIKGNESILNYFLSIFKLRRILRSKRFDIIHGHFSYSGWISVFQRKIPTVVSFMGNDLYGRFKKDNSLTVRGYFEIFCSKILQIFVDGIIVKSKEMQDMLIKKGKSIVLPNGVNFKLFKKLPKEKCRKYLGLNINKKYILFAGDTKSIHKGFYILKNAYAILNKEVQYIELITISEVPHKKIPIYLSAADVLAFPSMKEGSSNLIKEAVACNLPIVATDVGDVKEIIEGVKGCMIAGRNPNEFAEAIHDILNGFEQSNGREIINHLRMEKIAKRLINFYEYVINLERKSSL